MFPTIQIGPLSVQAPGLMLLLGLWLGLWLAERHADRHGITSDDLANLAFTVLLAGLAGGRLSYALQNIPAFAASPLDLLSLNPQIFDPWGAALVAAVAGLVFGQRKKLALLPTLDALTPALAVLAVGIGVSHLASGKAFGMETGLPWAIELWGARRHPAQVYEIIGSLATLGLLWPRKADPHPAPGSAILTFIALSAGWRLFLEAFRGDSTLLPGGIRLAQVVAWLVLAAALWGLSITRKKNAQNQSPPRLL
jgi:phosphatidylglycerol:prolipoprotein diacylglycerol transferase